MVHGKKTTFVPAGPLSAGKLVVLAALAVAGCTSRRDEASVSTAQTDTTRASRPPTSASSGTCGDRTITGDSVGALRIGLPADSLRARCHLVRDSVEIREEGQPVRAVAVEIGGDTIVAELDSGRVWRIELTQPGFATTDSLGVGSTLAQLLRQPGATGHSGETGFFILIPSKCGLSFRLDTRRTRVQVAQLDEAGLRRLPGSLPVDLIYVFGCRRQTSAGDLSSRASAASVGIQRP